jgi:transaldolase
MKIFIDSAAVSEIRDAKSVGVIDGVTTNPSLLGKEKGEWRKTLREICEIVDGPVSAEVTATDVDGMVAQGRDLAGIHPHIVVKVPLTREGLVATRRLRDQGIAVNVTLCFSASQALLAAKAGASYISPFIGRLDDVSATGMDLVREIVSIYGNYAFETEVLVASVRHPVHVVEAAMTGADVATMPYKVLLQLLQHPLTDVGLAKFLEDWRKSQG